MGDDAVGSLSACFFTGTPLSGKCASNTSLPSFLLAIDCLPLVRTFTQSSSGGILPLVDTFSSASVNAYFGVCFSFTLSQGIFPRAPPPTASVERTLIGRIVL